MLCGLFAVVVDSDGRVVVVIGEDILILVWWFLVLELGVLRLLGRY